MSIQKDVFYRLVKISDLATLNRNTFVQIIGKITLLDGTKVQIDDSFSKHTIELGERNDSFIQLGRLIRVFGNWDGIKMTIEKILELNIDSDKIPILFSPI